MNVSRKGSQRSDLQSPIDPRNEEAIERVRASIREIRFGAVVVVVQDGVIVQVERTEKIRFN